MEPVSIKSFDLLIPKPQTTPQKSQITPQVFFVFLGLMNNLPFSIILSSIQDSLSYTSSELNIIYLGIGTTAILIMVVNILCISTRDKQKMFFVVAGNVIILLIYTILLAVIKNNNSESLIAKGIIVTIAGGVRFAGETLILSYIGNHNVEWLSGWNMGTGVVSLLGIGFQYLMNISAVYQWITMGVLVWLEIIVGFLLYYVHKDKTFESQYEVKKQKLKQVQGKDNNQEEQEERQRQSLLSIMVKSWKYLIHMVLIYFMSSCILLILLSSPSTHPPNVFLAMSFYTGTSISRSSFFFIKMQHWAWVNLVQLGNFILLFVCYFFLEVEWIKLVWILIVGVATGTVYVNLFYQMLRRDDMNQNEKGISINYIMIGSVVGELAGVGFTEIFQNILSH